MILVEYRFLHNTMKEVFLYAKWIFHMKIVTTKLIFLLIWEKNTDPVGGQMLTINH